MNKIEKESIIFAMRLEDEPATRTSDAWLFIRQGVFYIQYLEKIINHKS